MSITLSPIAKPDEVLFCEDCEEDTNHVSMLTELHSNPGVKGYNLECAPCSLSWDWS
jgi:hypothetical protein